jgi:hypothetical protein
MNVSNQSDGCLGVIVTLGDGTRKLELACATTTKLMPYCRVTHIFRLTVVSHVQSANPIFVWWSLELDEIRLVVTLKPGFIRTKNVDVSVAIGRNISCYTIDDFGVEH